MNYGGKGEKMAQNDKTNFSHSVSQELYLIWLWFLVQVRKMPQFILKYFCVMGHNILTKFALVSFPQKSPFNTMVQFGHNFSQNHTISCPRQLCLMIHSLKILKYTMIGYNSYTKVAVNLPKKFPVCNVMSHDSLFEDLFEVLWHYKAQYR